jgi:G:T-mismatch repair DNA endonuclease (very short patch repair protein)
MDYIYNLSNLAKKSAAHVYVIAHNSKGYDSNFILKEIVDKNYVGIELIMQGNKILRMKMGNTKFIDSLAFLNLPLRDIPKAYALEYDSKGFFPHEMHTTRNVHYKGWFPSLDKFGLKYMKPADVKDLKTWHKQEKNRHKVEKIQYNLHAELKKYCIKDVQILVKGFLNFRREMVAINGLDPITRSFTLASTALEIFRSNMLKQYQIGITPTNGYTSSRKQSKLENCWLDFIVKKDKIKIKRQFEINRDFVDGFCVETNTIYEFHGCFWHAHDCQLNRGKDRNQPLALLDNKSLNEIKAKSDKRLQELRNDDYNIVVKRECELLHEMSNNSVLKAYITERKSFYSEKAKAGGVIRARDAFFGGRTNCIAHYAKNDEHTSLHYVDFKSLYPYVLKNRYFPIGHPRVI